MIRPVYIVSIQFMRSRAGKNRRVMFSLPQFWCFEKSRWITDLCANVWQQPLLNNSSWGKKKKKNPSTLALLPTRPSHTAAIVAIVEMWVQNRFSKAKAFKLMNSKEKKNLRLSWLNYIHRKQKIHCALVKWKKSEINQYDKQTFPKGSFCN